MYAQAHMEVDLEYAESPFDDISIDLDGILSFDDIPEWCTAYYEGDVWWVSQKSHNVVPQDGNHLELWSQTGSDVAVIHEDYVNMWLYHKRNIHFNVWEIEEVSEE